MEYDKINNSLGSERENLSKFVTREYVRVNSLFNTYNENKSIRLRSDLCDYADVYILVNGTIIVAGNQPRDRQSKPVILKNNAPFVLCITRVNGELDADDLDIVVSMYNLLEYSKNHKKHIGSLCNYYRDELNDDANLNNFVNNNAVSSNSFQYKNKIIGNTYNIDSTIAPAAGGARVVKPNYDANNSGKKNVEKKKLVIPLKCLGNYWRALNMPLISCDVSL